MKAIRDWADKNGFDVAPRERIKADVIDTFDAAH
ncbi:histone-like nucleoid-structuring protein Lsr2 [Rhodococcus sp. NPDC056516]